MRNLVLSLIGVTLAMAALRPASSAPAPTGTLNVALPAGSYTLWLRYKDAAGADQATATVESSGTKVAIDLAPLPAKFSAPVLVVLDGATGNAAVKPAPAKAGATTEMAVTAADFNTVYQVRVRVLDAARQPAASGTVTLTEPQGKARTQPILPGKEGTVDFDLVPFGKVKVSAAFADGTTHTEDLQLAASHGPGAVALEMAPANAVAAATANPPAPATPSGGETGAPASAPGGAVPAPPAPPTPVPAPAAPAPGGGGLGTLIGLVLLGAIGYVGYRAARERGVTIDGLLKSLGVTAPPPDQAAAAASEPAKPMAPPPPLVPEGHCPYCGQAKDASGACGCSVGAAPAGAWSPAAPVGAAMSAGPRLVAVQGPAMGSDFPLEEAAVIGRAPECVVALVQDSAVSRRHASLTRGDAGYVLRDEGSSNGTFVNGMRVTERALQPGDEIQVGNTRLRFDS